MQQGDIYACLGVAPSADLPEIIQAYRQAVAMLKANAARLEREVLEQRMLALRQAFEIVADPRKRSAYDLSRRRVPATEDELDVLLAEAGVSKSRRSPLRTVLIVIAVLLAVGLVIQVSVMFLAYRRAQVMYDPDGGMASSSQSTADRVVLKDLNMTYGLQAKTRQEAEALVAEKTAREKREQEARQAEAAREQREFQERDFAERARREADRISADLRAGERRLAYEEAEKKRRMEAEVQQHERALRDKVERDAARWHNRSIDD